MKSLLSMVAVCAIVVSSSPSMAQTYDSPEYTDEPASYIVLCDCNTRAKRTRIQRAIVRAGGEVVFAYTELGGFAVTPQWDVDETRFVQKLVRIPGITSVEYDGQASIQ